MAKVSFSDISLSVLGSLSLVGIPLSDALLSPSARQKAAALAGLFEVRMHRQVEDLAALRGLATERSSSGRDDLDVLHQPPFRPFPLPPH